MAGDREAGAKRRIGEGGVKESREERAGSGIPKVAGSGRNRGKICNKL